MSFQPGLMRPMSSSLCGLASSAGASSSSLLRTTLAREQARAGSTLAGGAARQLQSSSHRSLSTAARPKLTAPQGLPIAASRGLATSARSAAPRPASNAFNSSKSASSSKGPLSSIWAAASRRFATGGPGAALSASPTSVSQPGGWSKLLINVGIVAGAAFGAQLFLNRPTRENPLSAYAQDYLHSTFKYLAGGLVLTAASAVALHRSGFTFRLMQANPWLVLGAGLLCSIGGMIGAQTLEPGSAGKYLCWGLFNLSQAAVLSPLLFFNPAVLARAGLYTAGVVGSLCYVGATAKDDAFLWMGGPLLAGLVVVALSSLSPMILPARYLRTLAVAESLSMYGGLAVFSGFVLWDTQKVLQRAKMAEAGMIRRDPLRESIGLELDFIK